MIPANGDFIEWLDDNGELKKDAPEEIKQSFLEWKKQNDKLEMQRLRG